MQIGRLCRFNIWRVSSNGIRDTPPAQPTLVNDVPKLKQKVKQTIISISSSCGGGYNGVRLHPLHHYHQHHQHQHHHYATAALEVVMVLADRIASIQRFCHKWRGNPLVSSSSSSCRSVMILAHTLPTSVEVGSKQQLVLICANSLPLSKRAPPFFSRWIGPIQFVKYWRVKIDKYWCAKGKFQKYWWMRVELILVKVEGILLQNKDCLPQWWLPLPIWWWWWFSLNDNDDVNMRMIM